VLRGISTSTRAHRKERLMAIGGIGALILLIILLIIIF
jgi:hypothetical protein